MDGAESWRSSRYLRWLRSFEVAYGSAVLKKTASILSVISLFMILVAQIIASHKFLVTLGMSKSSIHSVLAIVIIYTTRWVESRHFYRHGAGSVFSGVFLACFWICALFRSFGINLANDAVENFSEVSPKLCGWLLMPILFMVIEQDMGQRCFAGASAKVVSRALF